MSPLVKFALDVAAFLFLAFVAIWVFALGVYLYDVISI